MASEFDPTEQWDRVASELRAHKQSQQQAWGDVDNTTLGRYLAGDLSGEERQQVEQALTELPELRRLTDIVRDVLDEFDPAAPVPVAEAPKIIPFPQQVAARKSFGRVLRQRGALLAAACLLLGLGLTLGGMRLFTSPGLPNQFQAAREGSAERPNGLAQDTRVASVTGSRKDHALNASDQVQQRKEKEMIAGWKQLGTSVTSLVATTEEQVGEYYQEHGDLDRAETFLASAHTLRCKTLGDDHRDTDQTNDKLAKVYRVALNTVPPVDQPASHPKILAVANHDSSYTNACTLRDRLTRQNPEEVKQSVVPVLVRGFRSAKTPYERRTFVRALGTLGPAAGDAVSDLQKALENKETTPEERVVVFWALGQIGPAALPAVPALMDSLQHNSVEVQRAAGEALVQLSPYAREDVFQNAKKGAVPHNLMVRIQGPEGRVGVNDTCLSYSSHTLRETQRHIQFLARNYHVEVYTETVASLPEKDAKKAEDRAKEVTTNGIYLLICKEPPSVEVVVSEALRRKGFTPACQAEFKKLAEDAVKKRDFDRGLLQSVRYVTQFFEQKEVERKAAFGSISGGVTDAISGLATPAPR